MLKQLTAGESHGRGLAAILEGIPAAVPVSSGDLAGELARRRLGLGRGGRQKFEADTFQILSGVRHGLTLGSPIAVTIENSEWKAKYSRLMSPDGVEDPAKRLTRPRPGHADLIGVQKYGFDDVRNVLERASARETAARVALGYFCKAFLAELGIHVLSHVVRIGRVASRGAVPERGDVAVVDRSPVRCFDAAVGRKMADEIRRLQKARDTVGGVVEVLAYGLPPGLGSYVHHDRKLDGRLAQALMSIQSVKGVEVGDGFATAARPGSKAHDVILPGTSGPTRRTAKAGGVEGGMSTGQTIRVRAALKPFSSLPKALPSVDIATGKVAEAMRQRTDVCAVPAGGVVAESAVAYVLADAVLEKFGGDSLPETRRNLENYLAGL
jgi:chorismate synthase